MTRPKIDICGMWSCVTEAPGSLTFPGRIARPLAYLSRIDWPLSLPWPHRSSPLHGRGRGEVGRALGVHKSENSADPNERKLSKLITLPPLELDTCSKTPVVIFDSPEIPWILRAGWIPRILVERQITLWNLFLIITVKFKHLAEKSRLTHSDSTHSRIK